VRLNRTNETNRAPPLGARSPSCAEHAHIRMAFPPWPFGLFAAAPPLWCNPRLGAAGATRSQGMPTDRSAQNINILRRKAWLRARRSSARTSGALEPATKVAND
jgi:hypothetical protein